MKKGIESFQITGINETIANLHKINGSCARPAVASGIRAALATIRKAIKTECEHPSVAATVRSRFKRGRKSNHRLYAKVGFGVGPRRPPRFNKSGGVGMSNYNIHWYAVGMTKTQNRVQYTTGRHTGKMWTNKVRPEPVKKGYAKSRGLAVKTARNKMQAVFIKKMRERIKVKGFRKGLGI